MCGRRNRVAAMCALVVLSACAGTRPVARLQPANALVRGELRVPIFMYHHVGPAATKWRPLYVSLPRFSRQMAAIARSGVRTLTMNELYETARNGRSLKGGAVALTFDDGTLDQYELVFPILRQYRLRATFYVAPGLFGKPGYMSWKQARELANSKLIEFESHTATHVDLTRVSTAAARSEIVAGKRLLEQELGARPRHFAYPYGHYDEVVIGLVREAGFVTGVTTNYEWTHDPAAALEWGRMTVHETNSPSNLAALARSSGEFLARGSPLG